MVFLELRRDSRVTTGNSGCQEHGITTLRYENKDVFKSPENICKQICEVIRAKRNRTHTTNPLQKTVPLRQGDEE